MSKKILILIFAAILLVISLSSCDEEKEKNQGISIVTTVFPQYDFVKKITEGTDASVKMLLAAGSEAHSYEPTPSDIIKASECDLFIWVGGESEKWAEKIIDSSIKDEEKILSLMDTVPLIESESGHKHGQEYVFDEHVWTSPKNAMTIVNVICEKLCMIAPENTEKYKNNTEKYISSLSDLDRDFEKLAVEIGEKPLIIGDRFPFLYLAKDYGFEYASPFRGCSSHTEASLAEIAHVIELAREHDAATVFSVDFSNEKLAWTIADEVGASVCRLYSCHTASKDDIECGNGYLELMKKNIESISNALGN